MVVGAYQDDDNGTDSGSAYVFTKPSTGWSNTSTAVKLTTDDGAAYDYFGWALDISGDTVVVGARGDDENGTDSGSAYLFVNAPGLALNVAPSSVNEGDDATTVTVTATLSRNSRSGLTLPLALSGSATRGTDYTATTTDITIPVNHSSATADLTINPILDNSVEGDETIVVGVTGAGATTTVTFTDYNICNRTPQVRDGILTKLGLDPDNSNACRSITPTDLATITELDLNEQSITVLKSGDFDNLTALIELRLYDNQLTTLPDGVFDNLTALTYLGLYTN